ncbi:flagellar hook-length control protein FliK [bacterium]|nr:flagellar hook-length control protein FliK [bacterium]
MRTGLTNTNLLLENINKVSTVNNDKTVKSSAHEFTDFLNEKVNKTVKTIGDLMKKTQSQESKNTPVSVGSALSVSLNEIIGDILSEMVPKIDKSTDDATEMADEIFTKEEMSSDEEEVTEGILLVPNEIAVFQNVGSTFANSTENNADNSLLEVSSSENASEEIILNEEFQQIEDKSVNVDELQKTSSDEKNLDDLLDNEILEDLNIEFMDVDCDSSEQNSMMQRQSPEEYGIKAILNKDVDTFEISIQKNNVPNSISKGIETNSEKLMEQIMKQMDAFKTGSKVNMVLNPESLGKVNVQLINSKDGLIAQLTVSTNEAKDLLMKGMEGLKDNLLAHGVNVDNLSIKVAQTEKETYNQDFTEKEGSRGGNKEQRGQEKENSDKELFEKTFETTLNHEGKEI